MNGVKPRKLDEILSIDGTMREIEKYETINGIMTSWRTLENW